MTLRSPTEHENGQILPRFVGCGEFTNRIERVRVTTDAVPVGHRILHRIFKGGAEFAGFGESVYQKLFTPRPQRLRGAISEPCFTGKPEHPLFSASAPSMLRCRR